MSWGAVQGLKLNVKDHLCQIRDCLLVKDLVIHGLGPGRMENFVVVHTQALLLLLLLEWWGLNRDDC